MPADQVSTFEPATVDLARARRLVLLDGVTSKLMDTTTGGAILAGLGLYLGAGNFTIGLLAALPFLAQVAQLPAVIILMRARDRRRITATAVGLARMLLLGLGILLLVRPDVMGPTRLTLVIAAAALLTVVATASWNWWIRDLIPRSDLGRFFSRRLRITTIVGAVTLLAAGAMLDRFVSAGKASLGYGLLFTAGGTFGLIGVLLLASTPHPEPRPRVATRHPVAELAAIAADSNNRRMMVALSLLSSTLTIALPFTAVYLLRSLGFTFLWVMLFAAASQLAYVGGIRGWGYLSDRFGNRPVLLVALGLLIVALLGWSIPWTSHGPIVIAALFVVHFLSGFAIGGIELSGSNILLKTAPEANPPPYLAAMSLTRALVAGAATLAAGATWQAIGAGPLVHLPQGWPSLRAFHVLALASALIGLMAMFALARIREEGGGTVQTVAKAMRREVHEISSVAGIRAFVHVVSYVVEYVAPAHAEAAVPSEPPPAEPAA